MPSANQRISEYVLDEKVGAGAFAEVWRAHHHIWTDQLVAVKIPIDTQYIRGLQREGVAIHGLVHPGIVRAMGFDPYGDPPYLIMEFVKGTSLRPLISDRKLKVADAILVMQHILGALGYAHAQGVIHRDVKPENVLVHEKALAEGFAGEGKVKVTDFGLGRVVKGIQDSIAYSASMSGPEGQRIVGTLDYMAPEQKGGHDVDARADLYSCGVMLYEMLTGERPAGTEVPSDLNPSVPKYLDEVFRRSYSRLDKRYASAEQFLKALSPEAASPPPLVTPARRLDPPRFRPAALSCPGCRQPVDGSDQFCMHCGVQLVAKVRRCSRCGAYPDPSDRFCIFCGQEMSETTMVG